MQSCMSDFELLTCSKMDRNMDTKVQNFNSNENDEIKIATRLIRQPILCPAHSDGFRGPQAIYATRNDRKHTHFSKSLANTMTSLLSF